MVITTAKELQDNFKAGLVIAGEDLEGNLQWLGTEKQFEEANNLNEINLTAEIMANNDVEF